MFKFKNFFCIFLLTVSSHAATLTCSFGPAPDYPCNVVDLTPVTQENEAITVINPPFTPYVDNLTSTLSFTSSQAIQQFPTKIFDIFIRIQMTTFNNISTTELGTDSFYNCKYLGSIYFMNSNLGHIRAGFASTCYFVTDFHANDCNIQSIDENAFVGMLNVERVYIPNNGITCIPPLLFQPLNGLKAIDLSRNKLTAIHSQLFADLPALNMISLSENLITYIPNFNLIRTGYGMTVSISIQNNPIQAIHPILMTSLNNERLTGPTSSAFIYFSPNDPNNFITCVDPNLLQNMNTPIDMFTIGSGASSSSNWIIQNTTYQYSTTCYTAFTATMASDSLVTCGSILTTTAATTLPPGGSTSSGSGSGSGSGGQCATDKICRYYLDWNNQYTCVIDGAEGTVTSISGTHYLSFTDADLTRLYFTNSHFFNFKFICG